MEESDLNVGKSAFPRRTPKGRTDMLKKKESSMFPKGAQLVCKNCNIKAYNLTRCPRCHEVFSLAEPESWMADFRNGKHEVKQEVPTAVTAPQAEANFYVSAAELYTPVVESVPTVAEPVAPVVEEKYPAAEPVAPVVEEKYPAAEPVAPVVEEKYLAAELVAPVVEEEYPATEPVAPAVEEKYPVTVHQTAPAEAKAKSGFSFAGLLGKKTAENSRPEEKEPEPVKPVVMPEKTKETAVKPAAAKAKEVAPAGEGWVSVVEELKRCKQKLDAGEITQEEFEETKARLLDL